MTRPIAGFLPRRGENCAPAVVNSCGRKPIHRSTFAETGVWTGYPAPDTDAGIAIIPAQRRSGGSEWRREQGDEEIHDCGHGCGAHSVVARDAGARPSAAAARRGK